MAAAGPEITYHPGLVPYLTHSAGESAEIVEHTQKFQAFQLALRHCYAKKSNLLTKIRFLQEGKRSSVKAYLLAIQSEVLLRNNTDFEASRKFFITSFQEELSEVDAVLSRYIDKPFSQQLLDICFQEFMRSKIMNRSIREMNLTGIAASFFKGSDRKKLLEASQTKAFEDTFGEDPVRAEVLEILEPHISQAQRDFCSDQSIFIWQGSSSGIKIEFSSFQQVMNKWFNESSELTEKLMKINDDNSYLFEENSDLLPEDYKLKILQCTAEFVNYSSILTEIAMKKFITRKEFYKVYHSRLSFLSVLQILEETVKISNDRKREAALFKQEQELQKLLELQKLEDEARQKKKEDIQKFHANKRAELQLHKQTVAQNRRLQDLKKMEERARIVEEHKMSVETTMLQPKIDEKTLFRLLFDVNSTNFDLIEDIFKKPTLEDVIPFHRIKELFGDPNQGKLNGLIKPLGGSHYKITIHGIIGIFEYKAQENLSAAKPEVKAGAASNKKKAKKDHDKAKPLTVTGGTFEPHGGQKSSKMPAAGIEQVRAVLIQAGISENQLKVFSEAKRRMSVRNLAGNNFDAFLKVIEEINSEMMPHTGIVSFSAGAGVVAHHENPNNLRISAGPGNFEVPRYNENADNSAAGAGAGAGV